MMMIALVALGVASCSTSGGVTSSSAKPSVLAPADDDEGPFADVDVCKLATADEVQTVMGVVAHDPQASLMGPGASIDGARGCTWTLGDSIDIFDLWIYPSDAKDIKSALDHFWAEGYAIEPIAGIGDQAFAAVWRGDEMARTVGQVAGVGVRQGGKTVLLSTLLIGEDYLNAKPAAEFALKILGRF
jgi:hypothetical protein